MHLPLRLVIRTSTASLTTTVIVIVTTLLFGQGKSLMISSSRRNIAEKLRTTTTRNTTTRNALSICHLNRISFIPQQQKRNGNHLISSSHNIFEPIKRTRAFFQKYPTNTKSTLNFSSENMSTDNGKTTTTTNIIEGTVLPPVPATSKRIFWIRHGEVINPGGTRSVYYGAQDVELSEFGKVEAQLAGQYLQQFTLHNIYSSTLSRAIYGATQVIEYQKQKLKSSDDIPNLKLKQLSEFIELDRGEWCGLTIDEIGRDKMKEFDNCNESVTPIGGESYPTVYNRVMNGKNIVLQQMLPGTSTAIVCHLQVTRCVVADALQISLKEMVQKVSIATASITCIDYNNDNTCTVHYQSFKPATVVGLQKAKDGAN
jgi:broad specificity phosphatase PhoE